MLLEIRNLLDVFASIGDDHQHGLWIEVPRGKFRLRDRLNRGAVLRQVLALLRSTAPL